MRPGCPYGHAAIAPATRQKTAVASLVVNWAALEGDSPSFRFLRLSEVFAGVGAGGVMVAKAGRASARMLPVNPVIVSPRQTSVAAVDDEAPLLFLLDDAVGDVAGSLQRLFRIVERYHAPAGSQTIQHVTQPPSAIQKLFTV
jgi:hypothetical protein